MQWDPTQYGRYTGERGRPFLDLLAQVGATSPRTVVDLGCGPGNLTALLARRWPGAAVTGVDSSAEMIATARREVSGPNFVIGNIHDWHPAADTDVVISNAALQWVPGHLELLRTWIDELPSGAWLAVQVPANFGSPAHRIMRSLAESPNWHDQVGTVLRHDDAVAQPAQYAQLLLDAGLPASVWQTSYLHVLDGTDPVLEWLRGTGLRPVITALSPADAAAFEDAYALELREAYPAGPHGTFFPFLRTFFVGQKP
jgi:trans-aconitate 2-methyltransferase